LGGALAASVPLPGYATADDDGLTTLFPIVIISLASAGTATGHS